jgi:hypothetical protein
MAPVCSYRGRCGLTFVLFGSLRGLIHPAVGLPARIVRRYVHPLEKVQTCFCVRCDVRVDMINVFPSTKSGRDFGGSQRAARSPEARRLVRTWGTRIEQADSSSDSDSESRRKECPLFNSADAYSGGRLRQVGADSRSQTVYRDDFLILVPNLGI